jgi:hypothetical protein
MDNIDYIIEQQERFIEAIDSTVNKPEEEHALSEINELMVITAEEAAEVAVECSKVIRFANQDGRQPQLEREFGDLMCMYELCIEYGLIDPAMVAIAANAKRKKLKTWSNLEV